MGANNCGYTSNNAVLGLNIEKNFETTTEVFAWKKQAIHNHEPPLSHRRSISQINTQKIIKRFNSSDSYAFSNKFNHERNLLYATNYFQAPGVPYKFQAFLSVPRKDQIKENTSLSVSQKIEFDPNNDHSSRIFLEIF